MWVLAAAAAALAIGAAWTKWRRLDRPARNLPVPLPGGMAEMAQQQYALSKRRQDCDAGRIWAPSHDAMMYPAARIRKYHGVPQQDEIRVLVADSDLAPFARQSPLLISIAKLTLDQVDLVGIPDDLHSARGANKPIGMCLDEGEIVADGI